MKSSPWPLLALLALTNCATTTTTTTTAVKPIPPIHSTVTIEDNLEEQQKLLSTLAKAYPDKFKDVELKDNDWTMTVNGNRFHYAHGRFLPEHLSDKWADYMPYDFYSYPWAGTEEQRKILYTSPLYSVGSSFLFDALYNSPTEDDSWDWQVKYSFLGVKLLIHSDIKPMLDRALDMICDAAKKDPAVSEWIDELQTSPAGGWNWRSIAASNRRSNHSYGIAIDLLPRDLRGRRTYWLWNKDDTTVDLKDYYVPPDAVIRAFEDNGFLWGGKWDLIDTMHFEYRPELLLLNGFTVHHLP